MTSIVNVPFLDEVAPRAHRSRLYRQIMREMDMDEPQSESQPILYHEYSARTHGQVRNGRAIQGRRVDDLIGEICLRAAKSIIQDLVRGMSSGINELKRRYPTTGRME